MQLPALGRRGGGWVVLQSFLFVAIALCARLGPGWPRGAEPALRIAGWVLIAGGLVLFAAARAALGKAFTPFPHPRESGSLQSGGIYAHARHPVYGAVLIGTLGVALRFSPLAFVPVALLALVFYFKSLREEEWLRERYPGYDAYMHATPRRFI